MSGWSTISASGRRAAVSVPSRPRRQTVLAAALWVPGARCVLMPTLSLGAMAAAAAEASAIADSPAPGVAARTPSGVGEIRVAITTFSQNCLSIGALHAGPAAGTETSAMRRKDESRNTAGLPLKLGLKLLPEARNPPPTDPPPPVASKGRARTETSAGGRGW